MNEIKVSDKNIHVEVSVFVYKDKDYPGSDMFIAYCPELDLAGYDDTEEGARKSFEIVMGDYIEDTMAKGTLEKDLIAHGWKKKKGRMAIPTYTAMFREGKLADVLGKSEFKKYSVPVAV